MADHTFGPAEWLQSYYLMDTGVKTGGALA